jgi:hypothetical protein
MKFDKQKMNKEHLDGLSQSKLDQHLIEACFVNDFESVKYLLTSPELNNHASIKGWDEEAFIVACRQNNIELVDYMLRSPELKEHANVHTWRDMVFKEACHSKDIELLNYLIFDFKIDKTEAIAAYLGKHELNQISKLFELGEQAERLTTKDFPKEKPVAKSKKPKLK